MWGAAGFVKSFLNYIIVKNTHTKCYLHVLNIFKDKIFFEKILDEHKNESFIFLFIDI